MKTDIKTLASLTAAIVWSDGEYSDAERETAQEIAEALELDGKELDKLIEQAQKATADMDGEAITDYLVKHGEVVDEEETAIVYEALMQMALCDGVLTGNEVDNLMVVAEALGMDQTTAVLLLCDMVKEEPELEISFED
ncbi:MAG: TerB family tellurite resistance protein [Muribaculaceae bacterium]|nr:TerB family tellurite resistance protein [Muribaculaceae bacterium]